MLTKFFSGGTILVNASNNKNGFTKELSLQILLLQLPWHRTWYFTGRNCILSIFFFCLFILFSFEDEFFLFIYLDYSACIILVAKGYN